MKRVRFGNDPTPDTAWTDGRARKTSTKDDEHAIEMAEELRKAKTHKKYYADLSRPV